MPDTIRTLVELNQMFADNTFGICSPQDVRDLILSMMVHGEIGSGAKSAITLGTGFQALDFTVAGTIARGLTVDTTNKWIADIPVTLKADVQLEVLFKGTNGVSYEFGVFKDSGSGFQQVARLDSPPIRILNAQMVGTLIISAGIQLAAGDKLQAGVRANGESFELLRGNLKVRRIGVE